MLLYDGKKEKKMNIFRQKMEKLANYYAYISLSMKYQSM